MSSKYTYKVSARRPRISLESKISALADIYVNNKPVKETLENTFKEVDRDLPIQTSMLYIWMDQIQNQIDSGNTELRDLAIKEGIVEKVNEEEVPNE